MKTRKAIISFCLQPPQVWYKDQPYEPKYFDVGLVLKDQNGKEVKGLDIPLTTELRYDGAGGEVKRKTILKLSRDTVPLIDQSGLGKLSIRIDSVSKNHDNRKFTIRVAADVKHLPPHIEVTPSTSRPIVVRSKRHQRNKRARSETPRKVSSSKRARIRDDLSSSSSSCIPSLDSNGLLAVASWVKYTRDALAEVMLPDTRCFGCGGKRAHRKNCKLNKCLQEYNKLAPAHALLAEAESEAKRRALAGTLPAPRLDTSPKPPSTTRKPTFSVLQVPKLDGQELDEILNTSEQPSDQSVASAEENRGGMQIERIHRGRSSGSTSDIDSNKSTGTILGHPPPFAPRDPPDELLFGVLV
mmetsp:Transcript_31476/g.61595  ORF Transcript_31476/g.61595 Transcript_31476/m.61595 type:complete len:356 (-) Transcript_31476:257-1324(-)|eukprot:CAMPEP_0167782816 /NCGR_PEP_ID=MMETSP0111_2-20121227/6730_1 /TAXON_ID=91324 /ORGANISM="Lotharella globosa, Strain CCCM811" /LENGTH=355 /DNA_ID=CAMNT_0007673695 /DNA_START=33 /DNA_END=1100 /DNA_ORIENTATION=-